MKLRNPAVVALVLVLAACGRSGPPAPFEHRGVGTGETSPGMARAMPQETSPAPIAGGTYVPPPGYGGSVQTTTLGEPNDAYSQSAAAAPAQDIRMNPPPPQAVQQAEAPVRASQPGQAQTLGTMPADTPVTSGVPVTEPAAATSTFGAVPDQGSGAFGWPLRGRLISGFGPKSGGQANDGLNIAAPLGSPVHASKEGSVAYAGNELRSFGNMVLVRHPGGMFTVYAHLDQISVRKEQPISKGQVIGTVGQSGGVSEPQLHFEVRRGSNPQDPMKYLGR